MMDPFVHITGDFFKVLFSLSGDEIKFGDPFTNISL